MPGASEQSCGPGELPRTGKRLSDMDQKVLLVWRGRGIPWGTISMF